MEIVVKIADPLYPANVLLPDFTYIGGDPEFGGK
jgi:hypothetical protein